MLTFKLIKIINLYYYKIWDNFHYFGLTHGKGWYCEPEWLLEFLKMFENMYKRIEYFIEEKAQKKAARQYHNPTVNDGRY